MAEHQVLLLETDDSAGSTIVATLERLGHRLTSVKTAEAAIESAAGHHLVIIDVVADGPAGAAVEVCRRMKSSPDLAPIPVLCVSPSDDVEERIRFLEAGADDVMSRPIDERELEARVDALLLRFQRTFSLAPVSGGHQAVGGRGRGLVSIFSPKGGVGTTTVAVNLALALSRSRPRKVAVVDFDLQFGQVATHLNIQAGQTLAQVVGDEVALSDPDTMRGYATHLDSGLDVIASPGRPEEAELIGRDEVTALIATLGRAWESVVVDAGARLDDRTLSVLEASAQIVVPVTPEFPALKAVRGFMDYLEASGDLAGRTIFVLNVIFDREILRSRDIEEALGTRIALTLPHDPFLYLKAANEGVPILLGAPRSRPAEAFERLAALVTGEPVGEVHERPARGGVLGGLLGRR